MKSAAAVASRMLKKVGIVGGAPRILNVDLGVEILGYTEINTQATTPFSRTKTHKGWFEGKAEINEGDLIQDRADGKHYLVMSLKPEFSGGINAYFDGTLYYANATCDILRFDAGTKNAFGRSTGGTQTIATGAYIMVNLLNVDTYEQEDQILDKSKLRIAIQAKLGVKVQDRLVTSLGETYKVDAIDKTSLNGLWLLQATADIR